ncbi:MAG: cytochrome c biogenesis protein ResB [Proteobacteria bacterium]|nr:cytochrome c biogenesis protein ResB [Pseudomonadota bacterium]MBU4472392.1 cytochrome c biogenesis protein ResB [Pseudomonadota bacterium]MCG2750990.1 cytochrome c biogenesis protein ResB [Desulfobacteraceae bacterium]
MNKKAYSRNPLAGAWSFFTSIKLTVVILLCLAAGSAVGTLIEQNQNPEHYIKVYGQFWYSLFYILDLFDMYHSSWFRLLMGGLCVNIIACSIHRLSAGWKVIFPKKPVLNPERIKSGSTPVTFTVKKSMEEAADLILPLIQKAYGFYQVQKKAGSITLSAEKNRWSRIGVYVVHLSVILLVVGGLAGSFLGFEGYVNIPEGESTDHVQLRNSESILPLPFEIRCDDFEVSFYASGAPKEFKSRLVIVENGKPVVQKDIIVNDPLRYKGISIYQSSYGRMPDQSPPTVDLSSKKIQIQVTAQDTGMSYTHEAVLGETFELPEGKGTFLLKEHRKADTFMGRDIGDTLVGIITAPGKDSEEITLSLRFSNFDKMRKGFFVFSIANPQDLFEKSDPGHERFYTGLQVSKDPGVWIVYAGFILMITGCFVAFFLAHQQIVVEIVKDGKKSRVLLGGTANKNKAGMGFVLNKLSGRILKKLSSDKKDAFL